MDKPKIILGTWAWGQGEGVYGKKYSNETLRATFKKAIENGFKAWDTSFNYGMGKSEQALAHVMNGVNRDDLFISDKVSPRLLIDWADEDFADKHNIEGFSDLPGKMIDVSLENLQIGSVDMYWVHTPDKMEEILPALKPLVESGKIKNIGLSNFNIDELAKAKQILEQNGLKIAAVQNHYSLLNRTSESSGIMEFCKKNDIDFWGYMVLEQGALTGKYGSKNPFSRHSMRGKSYNKYLKEFDKMNAAIKDVATKHNVNTTAVPIAWAISKGVIPVVGATDPKYIDDYKAAENLQLTPEEISKIESAANEISKNIDFVGGWEQKMEPSKNEALRFEKKPEPNPIKPEGEKKPEPNPVKPEGGKKPEPTPVKPEDVKKPEPQSNKSKTSTESPKTISELKQEYRDLMSLYEDVLDELEEKRQQMEKQEIPYSEYSDYAAYAVDRYNYMKKLYTDIMALQERENATVDKSKQGETKPEINDNSHENR